MLMMVMMMMMIYIMMKWPSDDDDDDGDDDDGGDQDNNAEDKTNLGFVSEDENHGLAEAMAQRVRIRNMQGLDILGRIFWGKLLF